VLAHAPKQAQQQPGLDELVPVDGGAQRRHQLPQLVAVVRLCEGQDKLQVLEREVGHVGRRRSQLALQQVLLQRCLRLPCCRLLLGRRRRRRRLARRLVVDH
jgi:hypothetical protein